MSQYSVFSPKKIYHQLSYPSTVPPHEVAAPREETASSHLSLETEIDQFCLEGEGDDQEESMVQILDSEGSLTGPPLLVSQTIVLKRKKRWP